jgi:DNA-binding transcriptional ArsR family regulator
MVRKHDPSDLFRVLGATTRLHIIELLKKRGSMGVTDLADELGVTPAAISQHLKLMRQSGLVTKERDGYRVPYSLDADGLTHCCSLLVDACSCDCHGSDKADISFDVAGSCCHGNALEALEWRKAHLEEALMGVEKEIRKLRKRDKEKTAAKGATKK